ncbi:MAG: Uma2 family endonuclease [Pirellulaceae bacterium]
MSIAELKSPLAAGRPAWRLDEGSNGRLMSLDEFEALEADDCDQRFRYELINGVVIVSPAPADAEADPNGELETMLRNYRATHPLGKALDKTLAERDVRTRVGIRRVDRALWIGFGRRISSKRDLPTIIVEFVSPGKKAWRRDFTIKREEYLELGTKEYWVVDRFNRTLTVFFLSPADPLQRVVTETQTYTTPLLPGFELPLKQLLELADEYED